MTGVAVGDQAEQVGRPKLWPLAVAVVAALVLGAAVGVLVFAPEREPSDLSAEAGFARDMSVHHGQAIELAFIVYEATDDPQIRRLAYDLINTQRAQVGMFSGWLQQWQLPQTSVRAPMMWADHAHAEPVESYADMPGMASDDQVAELRTLRGTAAEVKFLELMIEHHRGGVEMAQAVVPLTDRAEVQQLAQTIIDGQQSEIAAMQELLAQRDG